MSMTGSLMGYENNNDVSQTKCKKPLKPLPVVSNSNASNISGTTKSKKIRGGGRGRGADCGGGREECSSNTKESSCIRGHVNSLWSIWYGILAVAFQAYIAMRYAKRFAAYLSLPWPADAPPPKLELYGCLVLAGTGVVLLPALLGAAFLKLGNLANDGMKLGRHLSACSRDTPSLLTNNSDNGLANNLWRHGGPTAAFVHLCTAMCFLLPSLLMEARLIHAGFLPKEAIWRTDLDWVMIHRDRLVLLSFMHPSGNLSTLGNFITPQPFVTISPDEGRTDNLITTESTTLRAVATISHQTGVESPRTENSPISKEKKFSITFQPATTVPFPSRTKSNQRSTPTESIKMLNTVAVTKAMMIRTTTMISTPTKASVTSGTATNFNEADGSVSTNVKNSTSTPSNNAGRQRFKGKNSSKMAGASSSTKPSNSFQGTTIPQSMPLIMNNFADLDHPENLNLEIQPVHDPATDSYGPATLEYINYAAALGVYSVRYPAVFWSCNKALGTIFSIQLVMNSAQSLLSYAGMSVLYKVQVVGPLKVLPLLRHQRVAPPSSTISSIFGDSFFLLNPHVTLALFALSSLLVLCSSMVMYFYAHGRFTAFLNQERERRVILPKESREGSGWVYFTHCTALCVFLAIAICSAPLLYDYTVVYRGSLDGVILACIVGTIFHLLFWLALWVFLTVKQRWTFKLRVTIGRATVRSARSVKLVTDVDLLSAKDDDEDGTNAPLLVVGNGRTYTIADVSPKKAIMNVIQKAAMERRSRSQGGNGDLADGDSAVDSDEQIYWLRPKLRHSPDQPPNEAAGAPASDVAGKGWLNKRLKPKVTFNDLPSTSGARNKGKARRGVADGGADDDGDYATLRELPLMTSLDPADDSTSEENKLLECVNNDEVTYYASANRDLQPSEGDPSPLLSPDPQTDLVSEPLPLPPPTPTTAPPNDVATTSLPADTQINTGQTPRCLRRTDSGVPHEELTPRSDSSKSPPLDGSGNGSGGNSSAGTTVVTDIRNPVVINGCVPGSNAVHSNASSNSETSSSGVHSNASNVSNASHGSSQRRATSVDDLTVCVADDPNDDLEHRREDSKDQQWRSCSLQRGTQPPRVSTIFSPPPTTTRPGPSQSFATPQYANHLPLYNMPPAGSTDVPAAGCPAIILENPSETTVVIRRKLSRTKVTDPLNPNEEPFGRSTNMRMTSFTECNDLRVQASSATLPHYPTQPIVTYPHCSTMPLPHSTSHNTPTSSTNVSVGINIGGAGTAGPTGSGSCGSVTKHSNNFVPSSPAVNTTTMPGHTTLPSHHNGVRLLHQPLPAAATNPFMKRFPPVQFQSQPWTLPGHHTFPQAPPPIYGKFLPLGPQIRTSDRDSANFSMASSGDSDTCLPH